MSIEIMADESPLPTKSKSPKDKSEKKKSKKRRHEEQSQPQDAPAEAETTKPSKKRRKSETTAKTEDETTVEIADIPSESKPTTSTATIFSPSLLETASPFVQTTSSLLLPLAPQAAFYPIQGLCAEHLSPLLLSYYPPLDGILLSYSSPRLSQSPSPDPPYTPAPDSDPYLSDTEAPTAPTGSLVLARTADEYATPFVWLTADFLLLRPRRGTYMSGAVRVQNPSWLGLVCWNYFSAGIPRKRLPADWSWVEATAGGEEDDGEEEADAGEGHWVDGAGNRVTGSVIFRVRDFESAPTTERERGFMSIQGTLLGEEQDAAVDAEERELERGRKGKKRN